MRSSLRWIVFVLVFTAWACSHDMNGTSSSGSTSSTAASTGSSGTTGTGGNATTSVGSGGGATTTTSSGPSDGAPVILSFSASPLNLPAQGGKATLQWNAQNATSLSIDQGVGTVSGTSTSIDITATTIFTLTAMNAHGSVTAKTAVVVGNNPSSDGDRYVAMVTPTSGESFTAPATLRLIAAAHDPNVYTNVPMDGLGGNAAQVQFFVDGDAVLQIDGSNAEYWVFKGFTSGVAKGEHLVWARAIYTSPAEVLDSEPVLVTVGDPPAYDKTIDLTDDVVLSGSQDYALTGSADKRIRLNGHGHAITSKDGATGKLTLQFVDVFDLGDTTDTSRLAMDVTTTGNVTIEDSTFDTSDTLSISLGGSAQASIRRNTFRSNMRMPIGQEPGATVLEFHGSSSATKVFAGNNVGAGAVEFGNTTKWLVGGDTDADSNVLIGARVGFHVTSSTGVEVRRNYSHHIYYGGWSQGDNFELEDSTGLVVEHNVIAGSSWPIRGGDGELRYNLVLTAGHEWIWPGPNASIHHNVFLGGDNDIAGLYVLYNPPNVRIFNNTIDGQVDPTTAVLLDTGTVSLTSNAFTRWSGGPRVSIKTGTLTADYNFFDDTQMHYSDGRKPAHDVTAASAAFTDPLEGAPDVDERSVWLRATSAAEVLSAYRTRYTPKAGSPLIDSGDPAGGAGNDIGAVGAGQANTSDRFGLP